MNFNFGEVLTRAWQITWKYKVLWIFGILAGCTNGGGGGGGNSGYRVGPSDSNYVVRYYAYEGGDGPGILQYVPSGGEVDFQVQAQIGYYTDDMTNCRRYFTGETRDSSIITISFP